jgi:N-acetylmuramoyl-L-alanine amidase
MPKRLLYPGLIIAIWIAHPAPARTVPAQITQNVRPSPIVVIDAGHGGFDRGGIPGQRIAEKTMTLDVAQRLKQVLQADGYRVVMTRDSDVFVPLPARVAIANSYQNAIFVCIHFNAAPRGGANGIETYFYSPESLPLASAIHYYVSRGAPSPNRGVRRRAYYVLRKTRVPAVLVECGFLTNPTEAQYAQSVSYRQQLAEEIGRGVHNRSLVSRSRWPEIANVETVPLQPFIDQTKIQHYSKKGTRSSKRRKSSHPPHTATAKTASANKRERASASKDSEN